MISTNTFQTDAGLFAASFDKILGRGSIPGGDPTYQQSAAKELLDITHDTLTASSKSIREANKFLLEAPTGAGKTIITGGYIDTMFARHDKIVALWVSETPNLTKQSIDSLSKHFGLNTKFYGEDINTSFQNHTVIGINWEKTKGTKAREDTESTVSIDTLVQDAKRDGALILMFVDEAHSHAGSKRSREFLEIIDADIEMHITATPDPKTQYNHKIQVDIADVQKAGFIKQGIVINDLSDSYDENYRDAHNITNVTQYFLKQSADKRNQLEADVKSYTEHTTHDAFVPLWVVQMPNNNDALMQSVEQYISALGHTRDNGELAVYTADDYTDELDAIGKDQNVKVLLFKQAISKGWDCPRASVITLLRDPKKHAFVKQTIGRILRMPFLEIYPDTYDQLNFGYAFIEETNNAVLQEVIESIREDDIQIPLTRKIRYNTELDYLPKSTWNTIDAKGRTEEESQQEHLEMLDTITEIHIHSKQAFQSIINHQGVIQTPTRTVTTRKLGTDEFTGSKHVDIETDGSSDHSIQFDMSAADVSAEVIAILQASKRNLDQLHHIILKRIKDSMPKENAVQRNLFKLIVNNKAEFLRDVKRIYDEWDKDVKAQTTIKRKYQLSPIPDLFAPPRNALNQTDISAEKTPYTAVMLAPNTLETGFAKLLADSHAVTRWHKNGDSGQQYFSIAYREDGKERLFYPDFLVETDTDIYVLETKGQLGTKENFQKVMYMDIYTEEYRKARGVFDKEKLTKPIAAAFVKVHNGEYYMYTGHNFEAQYKGLENWELVPFY